MAWTLLGPQQWPLSLFSQSFPISSPLAFEHTKTHTHTQSSTNSSDVWQCFANTQWLINWACLGEKNQPLERTCTKNYCQLYIRSTHWKSDEFWDLVCFNLSLNIIEVALLEFRSHLAFDICCDLFFSKQNFCHKTDNIIFLRQNKQLDVSIEAQGHCDG